MPLPTGQVVAAENWGDLAGPVNWDTPCRCGHRKGAHLITDPQHRCAPYAAMICTCPGYCAAP